MAKKKSNKPYVALVGEDGDYRVVVDRFSEDTGTLYTLEVRRSDALNRLYWSEVWHHVDDITAQYPLADTNSPVYVRELFWTLLKRL